MTLIGYDYAYNLTLNKQILDYLKKKCSNYKKLNRCKNIINKNSDSLANNLLEIPLFKLTHLEHSYNIPIIDNILNKLDKILQTNPTSRWLNELFIPNRANNYARISELSTIFHIMEKKRIKNFIFQPSGPGTQMPDIKLTLK